MSDYRTVDSDTKTELLETLWTHFQKQQGYIAALRRLISSSSLRTLDVKQPAPVLAESTIKYFKLAPHLNVEIDSSDIGSSLFPASDLASPALVIAQSLAAASEREKREVNAIEKAPELPKRPSSRPESPGLSFTSPRQVLQDVDPRGSSILEHYQWDEDVMLAGLSSESLKEVGHSESQTSFGTLETLELTSGSPRPPPVLPKSPRLRRNVTIYRDTEEAAITAEEPEKDLNDLQSLSSVPNKAFMMKQLQKGVSVSVLTTRKAISQKGKETMSLILSVQDKDSQMELWRLEKQYFQFIAVDFEVLSLCV